MRLREIVVERIVNLVTPEQKAKYVDQVWDVLQKSYAPIGGFYTAETPQELIDRFYRWKVVVRNGKVTAVKVEKKQAGRKSTGLGTDGTDQGKKDVKMLMIADVKKKRGWIECSGKPEIMYRKMGAIPIPSKYAKILLNRPIESYNPDGYHYTRLFNGIPSEEIIFGFAHISREEAKILRDQGVSLHDLPENIKLEED